MIEKSVFKISLSSFDGESESVYELQEGDITRYFCEQCYKLLYAPICARCGGFIFGEVIKVNFDFDFIKSEAIIGVESRMAR